MDGILIVDKPQRMTSHDVVDFIRRKFKIKKVGHAGTLDPMATGVLVVLLGRATKLSSVLMNTDKEYEVIMSLGKRTDTGDADGRIIADNGDYSGVTKERLEEAMKKFTGRIAQTPPMMSAIKHKGKKLYELARKGIEVERQPRPIIIKELTLAWFKAPDAMLNVKCSKGTYVRVLCDDIGLDLGCGGFVSRIKRLRSGEFSIKDAVSLEDLKNMGRDDLPRLLKNENYYKFRAYR
ncbi:MAG: tRNA pseudouridine(55) synthase TruB [Candidatus Omnitrophica bacterium]|nr:tRNA pseudouridine(55) synthase TruB [Candidatus Omnitrophota bacterium]